MITRVFANWFTVVLSPKTAPNGERIQPANKSLSDAFVIARASVILHCMRYTKINDEALNAV